MVSVGDGDMRPNEEAEDYALDTVHAVEIFAGIDRDEARRAGADRKLADRLACGVVVVWGKP